MSQTISLTVPDALMEQARETAETTQRPVEAVLSEWLGYIAAERSVDLLSDEEVLRVCDAQLPEADQEALSALGQAGCTPTRASGQADGGVSARHCAEGTGAESGSGTRTASASLLMVRSFWVLAGWHPPTK